jgi:hypothetical protein
MDRPNASQLTCPRGVSLCDEQRAPQAHEAVIETPDVLPRKARWAEPSVKVIPKRGETR